MKILILSDSHGAEINLKLKDYDFVVHCGDYCTTKLDSKIIYIRGNCDLNGTKEQEFFIGDKKIWMTHGDIYNVKYGYERLIYKALEKQVSVCFFGHTHQPSFFIESDINFINPGSYKDGYYAILDGKYLSFYKGNNRYKKIEVKW